MWMFAYACMCYSYVWIRIFRRLSQATNATRWESGNEFECILIIRYIILFPCGEVTIAMEQNIITACLGEWIKIILVHINIYIYIYIYVCVCVCVCVCVYKNKFFEKRSVENGNIFHTNKPPNSCPKNRPSVN